MINHMIGVFALWGGGVSTLGYLISHFSVSTFTPMVLDTPLIVSASLHPHLNNPPNPPTLPLSHERCSQPCGYESWILGGRGGEEVSLRGIFGVLFSVDQRVPGSMIGWSSKHREAQTGAPGPALFQ